MCAVIAAMAACAVVMTSGWGERIEQRMIDMRFERRGEIPARSDVVVVGIDNQTDKALGLRFPYPRSEYAKVIDRLTAAGASAIVLDIQMLEADSAGSREDKALVDSMAASGRVILATAPESTTATTGSSDSRPTIPLPLRGVHISGVSDAFAASGAVAANSQQVQSEDGVMRWIHPVAQGLRLDDGRVIDMPSVAVAAIAMRDENSGLEQQYRTLPDPLMVNYLGPGTLDGARRGFTYRNFADIAKGGDARWASGKIILIGATSSVLQDIHETPMSTRMPGVEIHAHAIETIDNRSWITSQSPRAAALWALVLVILVWLAIGLLRPMVSILAVIAMHGAYLWSAQHAFESRHEAVLMAPTLAASTVATIVMTSVMGMAAVADRRRVTSMFSRYVARDVVRELLDVKEQIVVGGERRCVTILFADLRGFTTISEHLDPGDLVDQLNQYFEEMLEAIELQRGTFDKFIGDGLMAIFGAPLSLDDHAERACTAAWDMADRLDRINADRTDRGLLPLEFGIGIHTGDAVVGNIGSPSWRVEYTAIGDTVNLASRLESATKELGATILVSSDVVAAAPRIPFEARGSITVKGRSSATEVHELMIPSVVERADAGKAA